MKANTVKAVPHTFAAAPELLEQSNRNDHHYYASHAMGWATGATEQAAIDNLMLNNTETSWVNNCLKAGEPLVFFSCRVPVPKSTPYEIEWYVPKVAGLTECQNHLVLYKTKTKYAIMNDPRDVIKTLQRELRDL